MKTPFITTFIFAAALMLSSCGSENEPVAAPSAQESAKLDELTVTKQQFESSGMELGTLEMKEFNSVVIARGMIDVPPEYRASVSSYFGGTVKSIQLLPGEQVKMGQTLFTLENPEYVQMQQDYLEAKGQLSYLEADYQRQKNLADDNVTSQKKFLKAESDYTVTKVKLESLGKKLKLMNIDPGSLTIENMRSTIAVRSPISGYVTNIYISQGTFLDPSNAAVSIVNTEHIHLELNIFEKDLARVSVGQPIEFNIQEDEARRYEGSVHLINKNVDPEKRTVGIHGHLADPKIKARFNPGMYVEADILSESESRLALPEEALVDIDGQLYALLLKTHSDGTFSFERREMNTGLSAKGFVEITNAADFADDTQFLISGAFNLIKE